MRKLRLRSCVAAAMILAGCATAGLPGPGRRRNFPGTPMGDIAAVAVAFMLAFALRAARLHLALAWLASCCVVPAFVLVAEHLFPDSGRSAMLPFALFVGAIYGAAAGGVGALFAALMWKRDGQPVAEEPSRPGADV